MRRFRRPEGVRNAFRRQTHIVSLWGRAGFGRMAGRGNVGRFRTVRVRRADDLVGDADSCAWRLRSGLASLSAGGFQACSASTRPCCFLNSRSAMSSPSSVKDPCQMMLDRLLSHRISSGHSLIVDSIQEVRQAVSARQTTGARQAASMRQVMRARRAWTRAARCVHIGKRACHPMGNMSTMPRM